MRHHRGATARRRSFKNKAPLWISTGHREQGRADIRQRIEKVRLVPLADVLGSELGGHDHVEGVASATVHVERLSVHAHLLRPNGKYVNATPTSHGSPYSPKTCDPETYACR